MTQKIILSFLCLIFSISLAFAQPTVETAKQELLRSGKKYGIAPEDIAELKLTDHHTSKKSKVAHFYFRQLKEGIEVHQANGSVHLSAQGELIKLNNDFIASISDRINSASPTLSAMDAVNAVALEKGYSLTEVLKVVENKATVDKSVILSKGGISLENIPAKLMYHPAEDGTIRLTWDLSIYELDAQNWWSLKVDANTGEILYETNWVTSCNFDTPTHDCSATHAAHTHAPTVSTMNTAATTEALVGGYRVYPLPVETPGHGNRSLVNDPDNASASPFGWHDTNGSPGAEYTITRGNNAYAYEDGDNQGFSPDGGAGLIFDFPINTTYSNGDQSEAAAITNLFYWSNVTHDVSYQYGFDEASGNFQENNYGRGGVGSDNVNAEAQDGSGTCNANMGTPPDGSNPRMQMYVCNSRDGDLDNGVVVHEYGHGISNRLTGGASNAGCLGNSEQMGEGWSDYFGMVMTIEVGDAATDARGMGTWLFGQGPNGGGIRPFPYSTDFNVNPHTYDAIKTAAVPHGVGSVWAAMLWEMTWDLIAVYGFDPDLYSGTGGNNIAMALVIEGLKLQGCSPGFIDGRDGILAADQALYGGANKCLIWESFARRGLGFSADQGSSGSRSDGVEAFDLPSFCSNPEVNFLTTTLDVVEGAAPLTASPAGDCRDYTDLSVGVWLSLTPSAPAIVNLTQSGSADLLSDYEILNGGPFVFSDVDTQYITIRVYDDGNVELSEDVTLTLAIGNAGTTDATAGDPLVVTLGDNDIAPGAPMEVVVYNEDFETGNGGFSSINAGTGDDWELGDESDASSNSWSVPSNGSSQLFYVNDDACNCEMDDVKLISPIFDLSSYSGATLDFDIYFQERTYQGNQEKGDLMVSLNGGTYTQVATLGDQGSWRTESIDVSNYVGNSNVRFAFRYTDAGGWLYGMAIDNVKLTALTPFEPEIANTLNDTDEQDLSPNADVYFYRADGSVMARIENGSHNFGCVSLTIDRAGTGASEFWDSDPSTFVTDKTFLFTPQFNTPNADYRVTLYFTEAEVQGWEAETGWQWRFDASIVKTPLAISNTTSGNPEPGGPGTTEIGFTESGKTGFGVNGFYAIHSFSSGFSGMAVGNPGLAPLPVELTAFTAKRKATTAVLDWVTASEKNSSHFFVERSSDSQTWENIGRVEAKGTTQAKQTYQLVDERPLAKTNYYRLQQVDLDGSFEYSKVVSVDFEQTTAISIFPNPAKDRLQVELESELSLQNGTVSIFGTNGSLERRIDLSVEKGETRFTIDLHDLTNGIHLIRITDRNGVIIAQQKFTKID